MNDLSLSINLMLLIFACIQSVFGIGLLAFGTPSLLLSGFGFEKALSILLPCSMSISLVQVFLLRRFLDLTLLRKFLVHALPAVVVGLLVTTQANVKPAVKLGVGVVLLLSALLRLWPRAQEVAHRTLFRNENLGIQVLGLVHGLSNLGGGLLTVFSQFKFSNRDSRLALVSSVYLLFSIIQILTLVITNKFSYEAVVWPRMAGCLLVFFGIRKAVSHVNNEKIFHSILTIIIGIYGVLLLVL